jgi:hypothetical protein
MSDRRLVVAVIDDGCAADDAPLSLQAGGAAA